MRNSRKLYIAALIGLAGCTIPQVPNAPAPEEDSSLRSYYAAAEASLRSRGKLRTDVAPADARFSYDDLLRNFEQIALFDEYAIQSGKFVAKSEPTYLRRWERPIRIATIFGASTPSPQKARDAAAVSNYTHRLARLTGLDMRSAHEEDANFLVYFLNQSEQQAMAEELRSRFPTMERAVINAFRDSPRDIFCAAFAFPDPAQRGQYERAIILVKSEHSDLMRLSCIHEEMAQALGLSNDSRDARPSIFNDDEEFALLTSHDEILLKMLYDPRLKAGMDAAEVLPLLPAIVRDIAGP